MKHVIKRIDDLISQTNQGETLWHILMCIRLAAVDDWNIQQEIVDEIYGELLEHDDKKWDRYQEGFTDCIDFVLGLIEEKTGLKPMKEK
jgi:hypothetical protein